MAYATATDPRRLDAYRRYNWKRQGINMTIEQYDALLADQGGVCAICREECTTGRRLAVDHDHETGAVRGLLCLKCNNFIHRESPDLMRRAAEYLEGPR